MASLTFHDLQLTCAVCGELFVFSAGEQQLYALRGVAEQPRRCPPCARGGFGRRPR